MPLSESEAYNKSLMPYCSGTSLPDRSEPAQWITYHLWQSMRAKDRALADDVLEPVFT